MLKHILWGLVVMTASSVCMEKEPEEIQKSYMCSQCGRISCLGPLPGQTSHGRHLARHTWPPLTPDMVAWKYNGFKNLNSDQN